MTPQQAKGLMGLAFSLVVAQINDESQATRLKEVCFISPFQTGLESVKVSLTDAEDLTTLVDSEESLKSALEMRGLKVVGHYHGHGEYVPCTLEQITSHQIPGLKMLPEPKESKIKALMFNADDSDKSDFSECE